MYLHSNFFQKIDENASNSFTAIKVKVKQSRYRPGVAQRAPGS